MIRKEVDAPGLMEVVHKARREYPSSSLGVGGSWSSPKDLLKHEHPSLAILIDELRKALPAGEWHFSAWANVLLPGESVARHDHVQTADGPNSWAAIYYVDCDDAGEIVFHGESDERLLVKTGDLVVFPASLEHSVPAYSGTKRRVSVAFNVRA